MGMENFGFCSAMNRAFVFHVGISQINQPLFIQLLFSELKCLSLKKNADAIDLD